MVWLLVGGLVVLFVVLSAVNARYQSQRSGRFYDTWEECQEDEIGS